MITPDQRALFHVWCRQISVALSEGGVEMFKELSKKDAESLAKELIKMMLGNTVTTLGFKLAISTNDYVRSDEDLTEQHIKAGFISMDGLLTSIQAYAATDLNLELVSTNEEAA